jgi:hypothetical protein
VVSFMPQPLYPQGKSPWYLLGRRLGGPRSWSGCDGEEKNSPAPVRTWTPNHPAHSLVLYHWAIPAPQDDFGLETPSVYIICY